MYIRALVFLLCATIFVENAKILGIFHFPSKSHHILGSSLLKALAAKGHEVTMMSPFPLETPHPNYDDIKLTRMKQFEKDHFHQMLFQLQNLSLYEKMTTLLANVDIMDHIFFNENAVKDLIKSERKFDLVIQSWFGNDAYLALAHKFKAYTVLFSPLGTTSMSNMLTMNPSPYSYVPNIMPAFPSQMNFLERLINTFIYLMSDLYYYVIWNRKQELLHRTHFPNSPSLSELRENVSIVLFNAHYSIESPRPYVPNMIQVGGLQVKEPNELTGDLKKFMDSADEGVVLFSLGSNARSSDMPKEKISSIIKCFSKLPYKVLWKFESGVFPNLPKNVKIKKWLPQGDILGHKNIKIFVTHGGLLSTTEAIYHGVPMVGIPLFGDQDSNVDDSVLKGYMLKVAFQELDDEVLCKAINEVSTNPKYFKNIKQRSAVFKDQPLKPIDNAVFWVEYVLRHNGAHHLKTSAVKLYWYQYYLLDVISAVLLVIFVGIFTLWRVFQFVKRMKNKKTAQIKSPNKKKKN